MERRAFLSKTAAAYGGAYFTHQRSESSRIGPSLEEAFRVAKEANIRTQVWHLKTAYKPNWGRMPEVLRSIEEARARGIDVSANQYPYNRASNGLDACLPPWVREGGREEGSVALTASAGFSPANHRTFGGTNQQPRLLPSSQDHLALRGATASLERVRSGAPLLPRRFSISPWFSTGFPQADRRTLRA